LNSTHNISKKSNQKLVILGGGESGVGAALLGKKQSYTVFLSDKGKIKDHYKQVLIENNIEFEQENHDESKILIADLVIKSPGIPKKAAIISKIKEKNIPIISEIEFASRYTDAKIIAITGSNGKTTTTSWIFHILKKAGLNVALGGNIGKSFALNVANENFDYYVIEVSSFQLDDIQNFKPNIAIILNITPDHLDQYEYSLDKYAESKWRITENQDENDYLIYFSDDVIIQKLIKNKPTKAKLIDFSFSNQQAVAYADTQTLTIKINEPLDMSIAELALSGKHNVANSMASASTAKIMGLKNAEIRMALTDFESLEHRLEPVISIQGIKFINDSKATNLNSVYYALECMKTPVILILGGVDKGNDYNEILDLVQEKVKTIICLGTDNSNIINFFNDKIDSIIETKSMEEAVKTSYMVAKKGDTVLLSPACASFDLFKNYEDRGQQFKQQVRNL